MPHILIIDDEEAICWAFDQLLTRESHTVSIASSAEEGFDKITEKLPDVIVLDIRLPGKSGLDMLPEIREEYPDIPVIVITAHGNMDTGIEAMKRGAYNYLTKPMNNDEVLLTIRRATQTRNLSAEVRRLRNEIPVESAISATMIGSSAQMHEVYKKIGAVAGTDSTVLLTGESGTGKELVALAIHAHSPRSGKRFVAINCASLPETLLESELYGHVKGAFTGAIKDKQGRAELADGGTLFLDEIAEMPPKIQAKLLRFIEQRKFERVGSVQTIEVDTRIVAATNKDLERLIADGHFREDLYYRLNVFSIHLPPLRDRLEDISMLVAGFLARSGSAAPEITKDAMAVLVSHRWPGNVRELKHAIEHAVVLAREKPIQDDHLPQHVRGHGDMQKEAGDGLDALIVNRTRGFASPVLEDGDGVVYEQVLHDIEKPMIAEIMRMTGGNQVQAARILGIHRTTLRKKLEQYGLMDKTR